MIRFLVVVGAKGYEVLRQDTRDFVDSLREKGFIPPPPKATFNQEAFDDDSFTSVPTTYTSYTVEDKEKFHQLQEQRIDYEQREIQKSGFLPMGQVASCYILAKKGDDYI